jgi:hypothetical protein
LPAGGVPRQGPQDRAIPALRPARTHDDLVCGIVGQDFRWLPAGRERPALDRLLAAGERGARAFIRARLCIFARARPCIGALATPALPGIAPGLTGEPH